MAQFSPKESNMKRGRKNRKNRKHKKHHGMDTTTNRKHLHHDRKDRYDGRKENKYQSKFSKFVETYRNIQEANGYITSYRNHKRACKGIGWEAAEIIPDSLWLGSIKSASNSGKLYDLGISYILNCADPNYIQYDEERIKYLCLNAKDKNGYNMITLHLDDAIKFIEEARSNKQRILVHCIGGVNRSATIVVGYLLYLQDKPSIEDAIKSVLDKRPFALTNKSFQRQLLDYQHYLNKQQSNKLKLERKQKKKYRKHRSYHHHQQQNDENKDTKN